MNVRTIYLNARNAAAVTLGVAGLFGASFAVTSFVASAAEEQDQAPGSVAPAAPSVEVQAPAPTPPADRPAPSRAPQRPGRPAFKEIDANGDGAISQQEFDAFRPAGPPPPPFEREERFSGERPGFGPRDRGPDEGGPRGDFRDERFGGRDDREGPPPPPDGRFEQGRRDDRYGPPPPDDRHARGRSDDRYGPPRARHDERGRDYGRGDERRAGPDCDHEGGPRPEDFRGQRPHGGPGEYGPPPRGPRDGYGPGE